MPTAEETLAFLDTLKNPRFTTEDSTPIAPVTLDGTINGKQLSFIATQYDVMDYGREVWKKAHNGDYGKIAPFNPSLNELREGISSQCSLAISSIIKELGLEDPTRLTTLGFAKEIIISHNGKVPTEGQTGERLKRVADLYAIPINTLPGFIKGLEELRFGIAELSTQLRTNIDAAKDKKSLSEAIDNFEKELVTIAILYNNSKPPKNLAMPKPIKVPGL